MSKINICFSSDNNYAQHLAVTLVSILENKSPDDEIFVYVLDGGILEENKNKILNLKNKYDFKIKFLPIDSNWHEKFPRGKKNHVTLATYYRLLLPELCPEVDKLLYLDVDLIVKSSLRELFATDIKDNYFAAVEDSLEELHCKRLGITTYCNAGVLLLNLKKWREDNLTEKIFDWMRNNSDIIRLHDQDVVNCVCRDNILKIDKIWNCQTSKYTYSKDFVKNILPKAKIIHYVGEYKPWQPNIRQISKQEYFKYLRLTDYKDYEKVYKTKLYPNILIYVIEKILRFIFSLQNKGTQKIMTILGLNFKIKKCN